MSKNYSIWGRGNQPINPSVMPDLQIFNQSNMFTCFQQWFSSLVYKCLFYVYLTMLVFFKFQSLAPYLSPTCYFFKGLQVRSKEIVKKYKTKSFPKFFHCKSACIILPFPQDEYFLRDKPKTNCWIRSTKYGGYKFCWTRKSINSCRVCWWQGKCAISS